MTDNEILALVSLLEDEDRDIRAHVQERILALDINVINLLEKAWLTLQDEAARNVLSNLIHQLHFVQLKTRILDWKENKQNDLLWGLWLVATYVYPNLTYEELRAELEQLYYDVWIDFRKDQSFFEQIKILNSAFFDKVRFKPNTADFHDLSNSLINDVLRSRKGNPISLCCVYMLIAQKLELPVYGVNLPQLFILTFKSEHLHFYINAFNRGITFTKQDVEKFIREIKLPLQPSFFEPCSHLEIIQRFLRNMALSYQKRLENEEATAKNSADSYIQDIKELLLLLGEPPTEDWR